MTNNETLTEKTVVVNEFLLTLAESKLMEEMSQPHSHIRIQKTESITGFVTRCLMILS